MPRRPSMTRISQTDRRRVSMMRLIESIKKALYPQAFEPEDETWVRVPMYTDYEIHRESHIVRDRFTKEIIQPGFDPQGVDNRVWIELLNTKGLERYVHLDWIISTTLGKTK